MFQKTLKSEGKKEAEISDKHIKNLLHEHFYVKFCYNIIACCYHIIMIVISTS